MAKIRRIVLELFRKNLIVSCSRVLTHADIRQNQLIWFVYTSMVTHEQMKLTNECRGQEHDSAVQSVWPGAGIEVHSFKWLARTGYITQQTWQKLFCIKIHAIVFIIAREIKRKRKTAE